MDKLAMASILIATIVGPVVFARDPDRQRGLRRMLILLFLFNVLYVAYVTLVHARYFVPPERGY